MERLFVDTSAWFAYANRRDPAHSSVRKVLHAFEGRLVTSNYVFDESATLCSYRLGHAIAAKIGDTLRDTDVVDIVRITTDDEHAAWRLFLARADKSYSFTDCTSFVLLRRLRIDAVAALDADFKQEGFRSLPVAG